MSAQKSVQDGLPHLGDTAVNALLLIQLLMSRIPRIYGHG